MARARERLPDRAFDCGAEPSKWDRMKSTRALVVLYAVMISVGDALASSNLGRPFFIVASEIPARISHSNSASSCWQGGMTRGNQRDLDRARAEQRAKAGKSNSTLKSAEGTAAIMQAKQKAAEEKKAAAAAPVCMEARV